MKDYLEKSVVTVGTRATLPSIYVENETSGSSGASRYRFCRTCSSWPKQQTNKPTFVNGKPLLPS